MKTHYSDVEYSKKMARKLQGLSSFPPAIPFEKPAEKKTANEKDEKDKYKTFDIKIDKDDKDSDTVEQHIKVFEQGSPEDYIKWLEGYKELEIVLPLEKPEHKVNVVRSILKGPYLETFNTALGEKSITNKKVQEALNKVTLKAFNNDRNAYRRQVQYMRYHLYFNTSNFKSFEHRLKQLNKYLSYFPIPPGKTEVEPLPEDQLIEIIDNAKPLEYHQQMLQANFNPFEKSLEEFGQFIERLEASAKISTVITKSKSTSASDSKKKKRKKRNESDDEEKKLHKCKYCKKMVTHDSKDCWEKPGNKDKKPSWMKKKKTGYTKDKKAPTFTSEQVNFLITQAHLAKHGKIKKG